MADHLDYAYVAVAPCGCVHGICTARVAFDQRKEIEGWAKNGLAIERMPIEDAKARVGDCDQCRQEVSRG